MEVAFLIFTGIACVAVLGIAAAIWMSVFDDIRERRGK